MRLRELKCKNCGDTIKVDETMSKVECKFCNTTFAVDDAYQDGYKFEKGRMKAHSEHLEKSLEQAKGIIEPVGKVFVAHSIVSVVIGIIVFIVGVCIIIFIAVKQSNSVDEFDIRRFNNDYEMYVGSEYGSSVGRLIDTISTNNKKDEERVITVIYNDVNTQDPEKMKEIKKQLDDWTKYEVSFEYDEDGFIYQVKIEE